MSKSKWIRKMVLILAILGLICLPLPSPTHAANQAQTTSTLSVLPVAGDVILNNTTLLNLWVTAGVDVNAFDVVVTYDPALLTLVSWSHGSYLSNLANVYVSNTAGRLQVAATQLARPPVSGDGNLMNLTFRGLVNGIHPVTLTSAVFATPLGSEYNPARQSGTLYVHADPVLYPAFTLTGNLTLQGAASSAGVALNLGYGTVNWFGPYSTLTLSGAPNLNIPSVHQDVYRLVTSQPRYLNLTAEVNKTKSVAAGSTAINPLLLRGGNAVWQDQVGGVWVPNNVIDAFDLALVSGQYGTVGSDLAGDVNFSGAVDFFDLVLVAGNYGLNSAQAYAGWIP